METVPLTVKRLMRTARKGPTFAPGQTSGGLRGFRCGSGASRRQRKIFVILRQTIVRRRHRQKFLNRSGIGSV